MLDMTSILALTTCVFGYLCWRLDGPMQAFVSLVHNGRRLPDANIMVARAWLNRRVGLLNHASLPAGEGLWLHGGRRIHTFGMRFPIDLVFIDKHGKILALREAVPPNQTIVGPHSSRAVLELKAGSIHSSWHFKMNDTLELLP